MLLAGEVGAGGEVRVDVGPEAVAGAGLTFEVGGDGREGDGDGRAAHAGQAEEQSDEGGDAAGVRRGAHVGVPTRDGPRLFPRAGQGAALGGVGGGGEI